VKSSGAIQTQAYVISGFGKVLDQICSKEGGVGLHAVVELEANTVSLLELKDTFEESSPQQQRLATMPDEVEAPTWACEARDGPDDRLQHRHAH
jgi:hypothetical protein